MDQRRRRCTWRPGESWNCCTTCSKLLTWYAQPLRLDANRLLLMTHFLMHITQTMTLFDHPHLLPRQTKATALFHSHTCCFRSSRGVSCSPHSTSSLRSTKAKSSPNCPSHRLRGWPTTPPTGLCQNTSTHTHACMHIHKYTHTHYTTRAHTHTHKQTQRSARHGPHRLLLSFRVHPGIHDPEDLVAEGERERESVCVICLYNVTM